MTVKRSLPNGSVSAAGIKDPAAREAVMRLNENIACLAKQLAELQTAHLIAERDLKGALSKIAAMAAV